MMLDQFKTETAGPRLVLYLQSQAPHLRRG